MLFLLLLAVAGIYFTASVLWPLDRPQTPDSDVSVVLRNINLVDLETGELRPDTDIAVRQGRIEAVGINLSAPGLQEVDGAGRYAIPGLFDMHVHSLRLSPVLTHPLFIAAGVTAVRDMGGCLGDFDSWIACAVDKREWNRATDAGAMVGPRYDQITSLPINGGSEIPSGWDLALGAPHAEGARQRVALDAARGIDFLKPYSLVPRESYFALIESARDRGMYLAGHKPLAISGFEAAAAGQRSIEHAFLFIWECYPGIEELRKQKNVRAAYTHETRREMLEQHDAEQCAALRRAMIAGGTAFVPTHTTRKLDAYSLDPEYRSDPRLKYVPAPLRTLWLADADSMAERAGVEGYASYRDFYEFGIEQTGRAHAAGVTVMAGTDAPDSFAFPGFGLHDELGHLSQAGLSPVEVLRTATIEPARFLGLEGEAGVIAAGARADIVLLRDNPLEDVQAVRSVDAVVLAGKIYDRDRLDAMLLQTARTANHWSMWPKFVWQALRSPIFRAQFAD
ncbi:MAG: amidohydrolase family protein [Pseudomonadota bacterium]